MPGGGIPDRWEKYLPLGKRILGTRFIAFKVPLKEALCTRMPQDLRFTPAILLEKIQNIGLIVDLTNTSRYYNAEQEFVDRGVKYRKINCVGHVVPSVQVLQSFYNAVDEFLQESPENDHLIGVHCTHGVNRTGYLICSYMIHRMGFNPANAIKEFNRARGSNIERSNYIEALHQSILKPKVRKQRPPRDPNRPPKCPPPSQRVLRTRPPPQNLETEDSAGQYQHRPLYPQVEQQYPLPPPHYPPPPPPYQQWPQQHQSRQQFHPHPPRHQHQPRQQFRPYLRQQFHPYGQHRPRQQFHPEQWYEPQHGFPPRHQDFFNGPPNVPANPYTWRRPGAASSATHLRFDN